MRENDGKWSLPGGWCDVDQSVAFNIEKEVWEEAGCRVHAQKFIALHDWRQHNVEFFVHGMLKIFVLCSYESGHFQKNIEIIGSAFFDEKNISENLAKEKNTKEQILMCFDAYKNPNIPTLFD